MKFPRVRFRLRTLLLLFVVVAAICWFVVRRTEPRRVALQFVRQVNAGEYAEASALVDPASPKMIGCDHIYIAEGRAILGNSRWHDWWNGESSIVIIYSARRSGPQVLGQNCSAIRQSIFSRPKVVVGCPVQPGAMLPAHYFGASSDQLIPLEESLYAAAKREQ